MPDRKNIHVAPKGNKWATKREGAERASGVHDTQAEAIEQARNIAKEEKGQVTIHRPDGRIREERTYREDPCPPEG